MALDSHQDTPLHVRASHWKGSIGGLLELGADVHHGENLRATPIHAAAEYFNVDAARLLIKYGANVNALNGVGRTPRTHAVQSCDSNSRIPGLAAMAEFLLDAGAHLEPSEHEPAEVPLVSGVPRKAHRGQLLEIKAAVTAISKNFEFHRRGYNPESVDETSDALEKLYKLFDVPPVPRRSIHDGKSPIVAKAASWQQKHQELWELLIPGTGAADTVQGEVIRISGRLHREVYGNGGINWDRDFKKMAAAILGHLSSGVALSGAEMSEARELVSGLKNQDGTSERLCELAVHWVGLNPRPVKLPEPDYSR